MSGAGGAGAGASAVEAATTTPRTSKRRLRTAARRGSVSLSHMSLLGKAKILAQQAKRAVAAYHDEEGGSSWHWIKDHKEAYVAARLAAGVDARTDGKVDVLVGATGTPKTIKKDDLCWEIAHIESLNTPVSDMVKMDEVNEATILENLRARFKLDEIYTNIGTILVSINPFKWMDHLYTKEYVEDQLKLGAGEETTPHVFTIANASYQGLRNERLDQSIIISGESGAGKTEATKKCLQFFAEAAGRQSGGMEKRLLSANPILEAFGNAKTVRNNNSSRFGKWMVVHFDGRAQICGSQIVNYLLEKSRVVSQNRDERNYHIFYNLCTGGSQELKERLGLRDVGTYHYTRQCAVVDGMDDADDYNLLLMAMKELGFEPKDIDPLFQVVAGVMWLGNVEFEPTDGGDKCKVKDYSNAKDDPVVMTAMNLALDPNVLRQSLVTKVLPSRDRVVTNLNVERAVDARNSLAKTVYGRMFDWLVRRVNRAMEGASRTSSNIIGVLDIFGFEIFELNSFEQLCINFCNEKLQQHFNTFVFKAEEKCYQSEGIDYDEVKFVDNQDVLNLIEKRPKGLLVMLDDEIKVPKGSDKSFLRKVNKVHIDNPRYRHRTKHRHLKISETEFGVEHYAGAVVYDTQGWLEKNKDQLLLNLRELLVGSKMPFICDVLFESDKASFHAGTLAQVKQKSQSGQFRQQLDSLMTTLFQTQPQYIRCVKPNQLKVKELFDAPICLQQLRYAGVFEAVKIRQQGYPFRWTHQVFFQRYRCTGGPEFSGTIPRDQDWMSLCKQLLNTLQEDHPVLTQCKFGRTMVLYRATPHRKLERLRERRRSWACRLIQRCTRGLFGRQLARTTFAKREAVREAMRTRQLEALKVAVEAAERHSFVVHDVKAARVFLDRLLEEKECREKLALLLPTDPVDNYDDFQVMIDRAVALDFRVHGDETLASVEEKFSTVDDRRLARRRLAEGVEAGDRVLIEEALEIHRNIESRGLGTTLQQADLDLAGETLLMIEKEDQVLKPVRSALADGGPTGNVGALETKFVLVKPLAQGIQAADEGTVRTRSGVQLLESSRLILNLREALVERNHPALQQGVDEILKALHTNSLAREAMSEIQVYVNEVQNQQLLQAMDKGLRSGRAAGLVGNLDISTISTRELNKAMALGDDVGWKSDRAQELQRVGAQVVMLRGAMVDNEWRDVEKALLRLRGLSEEAELPAATTAEIAMAQDELNNQRILLELQEALAEGGPSGEPGQLDTSTVRVTTLSKRLSNALKDGAKTERARQLVDLARVTVSLRQALLDDRWDEVESVLSEAIQLPTTYSRASGVEFRLVQWEADDRYMTEALGVAVREGAVSGPIGQPDLDSIRVDALAVIRTKAKRTVCRSPRAIWLLEIANCLFGIRTSLLQEHWSSLPPLLASCRLLDGNPPPKLASSVPPASDHDDRGTPQPPNPAPGQHSTSDEGLAPPPPPAGPPPALPVHIMPPPGPSPSSDGVAAPPSAPPSDLPAPPGPPPPPPTAAEPAESAPQPAAPAPPPVKFNPEYALPLEVQRELHCVQDHMDHRTIMLGLEAGLAAGRVTGEVGALNLKAVSVSELEAAIRSAETIGPKASSAKQLLRTCLTVQSIRQAVVDGDWFTVQSLLNDNGIPCGRAGGIAAAGRARHRAASGSGAGSGSGSGAGAGANVSGALAMPKAFRKKAFEAVPDVQAEMELLAAEVNNQTIVQNLRAVLQAGGATGVVGDLNLADMDVAQLGASVKIAADMGVRTDEAALLHSVATALLALRKTLLQENWDSVGKLIGKVRDAMGDDAPSSDDEDDGGPRSPAGGAGDSVSPLVVVSKEVSLIEDELENRVALSRLREALTSGNPTGVPGALKTDHVSTLTLAGALMAVNKKGVKTDLAHQLLVSADMIMRVRTALLAGDWDKMEVLFDEVRRCEASAGSQGLGSWAAAEAKDELALVEAEMNNRAIVQDLTHALCTGHATGRIGELDVSAIDLKVIDAGIATAQRLGCHTEAAVLLLDSAKVVRRLREALITNNHQRLASVLHDASGMLLSDLTAAEFATAREEIANRSILRELSAALSRGMPTGAVGHMSLAQVSTHGLRRALQFASRVGAKTSEARQMVLTAKVVLRVRQALIRSDYTEAHRVLDSVRGKTLSAVSMHEIMAVQDEVENWVLTTALTTALQHGRAVGDAGDMDVGGIDVLDLRRALVTAEDLGARTPDARALVVAGRQILKLRLALVEGDWDTVDEVLEQSRELVMSDIALEELQGAQEESDNRRIVSTISAALLHGGPRGRIGELDISGVQTNVLDRAIATAMELGCVSEEAELLLATAKFVRRLRSVLQTGKWDFVEQMMVAEQGVDYHRAGNEEIELVRREVNNRRSLAMMQEGLATGQVTGSIGHVEVDKVDTAKLDEAIEFTTAAGCHTAATAELFDTCRMMAALRRAVIRDDMQAGRKILQQHKSVASVARGELSIIQQEIAAWQVTESLNAAVSGGMAVGGVGELDASSPQVEILDASIATARNLGCQTRAAQRCLLSAMIIRRLRGGLLKADWQFVAQVLEQADEQERDIVPAAKAELEAARNELKFRRCMALLRHSIRERDEKGLLEGIAIAEDLGLREHPQDYVPQLIDEGTLMLGKIERCKAALAQAMSAVDEEQLVDALALCDELSYTSTQVEQGRDLLAAVQDLSNRAAWSLKVMDRPEMERVLDECQRINLHIPDVAHIVMALRLPADEFLQRQLGAAVALRDADRVTAITVQIKEMFFEDCGDLFLLHKFPNLKAPREFSKRYGVADNGLRSSMLRYTADTIPQSLTRLPDGPIRRLAVRCFRCITGFMGDRDSATPLSLAQHLMQEGLLHPQLRDEILVQLTKQLNCNPTPNSVDRGWVLLELALSTFPPSEDFENYLEVWLRERHAMPCVYAMHKSIFLGPAENAPTIAEIEGFVASVLHRLHEAVDDGDNPSNTPPRKAVEVDVVGAGGGSSESSMLGVDEHGIPVAGTELYKDLALEAGDRGGVPEDGYIEYRRGESAGGYGHASPPPPPPPPPSDTRVLHAHSSGRHDANAPPPPPPPRPVE